HITADFELEIMTENQTLGDITTKVLLGMQGVIAKTKPDVVLVHGDTTTSFAAALAAFYSKVRVGHVEAGLRTYNKYSPFPEEMNRNLVSKIADIHFAPTQGNKVALNAEGITENVFVTGNTVIDCFATTVKENYIFKDAKLQELDFSKKIILLTAHRRENWGQGLEGICDSVAELSKKHPQLTFVYPVHPNPIVKNQVYGKLSGLQNVKLIEPIDVEDMHNLMAKCFFVLTDSGGLQEEAPHLKKPVVVLRKETERPEAVAAGTAIVAGTHREKIVEICERLLTDTAFYEGMSKAKNPYGDGSASRRIADILSGECF
ncbi:MAG: UDP-N-acetylglucosamine 2-epimerase (non-hydrolyzing), partial [Oscillospiraceae bacterium]